MPLLRPRLLFYAVNGLGLGHVTRLLAIARHARRLCPNAEIVFLTSSEAEDVIYREGFAAFKVPSKTLRAEAQLRAATYSRLLHTVALNIVAAFHPHILIVDTFPAGIAQELLPVLRWDSRKVFIYRAQRPEAAESPLLQTTLPLYDLVVLPHEEGEVYAPMPEGVPAFWAGNILIRDRTERKSREEARRILGLPPEGEVLYASFGGGGESEFERVLTATLEAAQAFPRLHFALAQAPLYRGSLPRRENLTPVRYYPMAELFSAFDAALSATGYNSAMELLHHGIPTAFLPFARKVDDQEGRAALIAAQGAGLALERGDAEEIQSAIARLLDPQTAQSMREAGERLLPNNGAEAAARRILELLPTG